MEFWRTILVLLRRKWVALPVLLFSLGMAAVTYLVMPTQYMSTETIVLTSATNGGTLSRDPTGGPPPQINPIRYFDGLKTAAAILVQVMNTRDVANQLGAVPGGATTFTVSDGSVIPQLLGTYGPFMVVEGYSTTPAGALNIVVRVEQRVRDELINQQRALHAPPSTFIGMIDVVPPSVPEAQETTKLEAVAGALVLGLIASIGVAYSAHRIRGTAAIGTLSLDPMVARHDETPTTSASSNSSGGTKLHGT